MSMTPLAYADSLRIGSIDFISPIEIKVVLDKEAPDGIALNTGTPRPFPQVNGYVLVPNNAGFLVGQIEWITIERSQFPTQPFKKNDFDLIDLPYPLRKMSVMPLGTLFYKGVNEASGFEFKRGISNFPSVGAPVLLPTKGQLKDIVESGEHRRVKIGTSPLADGAEVMIDPDRLFGRHLAVLGNTGSGKSCSVAGLIHWSLESAKQELGEGEKPNARFIVLDPNGEYSKAFSGQDNVRVFSVEAQEGKTGGETSADTTNNEQLTKKLKVPAWLWNSDEWSAFVQASGRAQRPLMQRALREMRNGGQQVEEETVFSLRRKVSSILISLQSVVYKGDNYEGWKLGPKLEAYLIDLESYGRNFPQHMQEINRLHTLFEQVLTAPNQRAARQNGGYHYAGFPATKIESLVTELNGFLDSIGGVLYQEGPDEDTPIKFDASEFADHLEHLASQESNPHFFDFLIMRTRTLLSETRAKNVVSCSEGVSLESWLVDYLGNNKASNGSIAVVDLSLIPVELIHIITAVISRMTLEALQRYRKLNDGEVLPTVLVMEEAHTFVKRYKEDAENQSTAAICCKVFEKIAREGRKFGLGMVLSSQRPSELSPTVLSQCNSFLLHRISNDRDQELVHRLVPDNLRGLLRDLPSLPARHAILLGWASELPTLVEMNHLSADKRPQSDDPDFWDVWSGKETRIVNWKAVADDWQKAGVPVDESTDNLNDDTPF